MYANKRSYTEPVTVSFMCTPVASVYIIRFIPHSPVIHTTLLTLSTCVLHAMEILDARILTKYLLSIDVAII